MEVIEGRGICCENEVYFDLVDGVVVMTMYRDMPGVPMDRREPNVIKRFSVEMWNEITVHLLGSDDDEEEEAPEVASSLLSMTQGTESAATIMSHISQPNKEENGQTSTDQEAPKVDGTAPEGDQSVSEED